MRCVLLVCAYLGVLGAAGCADSKTRQCSWGAMCPTNRYCEESLQLCLYPAQAEVCQGVEDASPLVECTFPDAPFGTYACQGGLCVRSICGDGKPGPGEVCDDGNTVSGDGCAADCRSDESCGNGVWDPAAGEGCDDGNYVSHDGCSSGCSSESLVHRLRSIALPPRSGGAEAFDVLRQRTVVFGGLTCEPVALDDTWAYDGEVWQELPATFRPLGRQDHSLTYLPSREAVVMFGGWSGNAALNDLWEFDGVDWLALYPATSPSPRWAHAAACDPGRERVVLFGGEFESGAGDRIPLDDHWEYDGNQWSRITLDATPAARRYAALAYDENRGSLVLFGGSRGIDSVDWVFLSDTWEYDGSHWTEVTPAISPDPRHGHRLRWDPVAGRLVLFGGMNDTDLLNDTWVYENGAWSQLFPATPPPPRGQHLLMWDPVRAGLLMQAGNPTHNQCYEDAWALVGDQWVQVAAGGPKKRVATGISFDEGRGVSVLFGGQTVYGSQAYFSDTWQYADHLWRQVMPSASPSARGHAPLAYDAQRGLTALFGGCSGVGCNDLRGDFWTFDGLSWTEQSNVGGPPARAMHAMTYDASAEELVVFGGVTVAGYRSDTWRFDGAQWRAVSVDPAPSPRVLSQMVYDGERRVVVLFGGLSASGRFLGDTWELRADGWREMSPTLSPPARIGHRMIFHAARGRVLVFGGYADTTDFVDAWEYDGGSWTYISLPEGAPFRADAGLVYDVREREVVLFGGGVNGDESSRDTWTYRYESSWPDEDCTNGGDEDGDGLVDCADPDCDGRPCDVGSRCVSGACQ